MLNDASEHQVYLACGVTDLRKSIDGLAVLVKECFRLDPFGECLFVFCNRQKNKLKMLKWDPNGFWLYYRRLERGRFEWPQSSARNASLVIDRRRLRWLLDGLSLSQPGAHAGVKARVIA